jgi:hypothetical protein
MAFKTTTVETFKMQDAYGIRVRDPVTPEERVVLGRQSGIVPAELWRPAELDRHSSLAVYGLEAFRGFKNEAEVEEYLQATAHLIGFILGPLRGDKVLMSDRFVDFRAPASRNLHLMPETAWPWERAAAAMAVAHAEAA